MRKSIIAGLTLCAALALAGPGARAEEAQAQQAQAGEAKAGEAKASEAKASEAKAGEAKASEAKASEAKASEAKASEAKPAGARHRRAARRPGEAYRRVPRYAEQPPSQFRIPAHPAIRDCVHVMFPQCGRSWQPLNDAPGWY
ncbi:MAG: hypothetical protein J2P53_15885 [Bradyrhizobiaceae bacterium]|nr:hypothetical protein [Bradyrhizobiaceae bacterium]